MVGFYKMIQALLLLAVGLAAGVSQPLACQEDYQCGEGYCDRETLHCAQCLLCKDFNRNPPSTTIACITTVSDCGSCYEGLVESGDGNLLEKCSAGEMSPRWVWVVIAVCGTLLLIAAIAIVVYALRNTQTFRILASTRASVQSPCGIGSSASAPSAPEPPPPYNTLYSPVRSASPPAPPPALDEEAAAPFIKPPNATAPTREAAGSQAANVYNNPAYVRGPHLPNNYHTAEHEEEEPEYLHDETTAESPWAPTDVANNNATNDMSESASGSTSASGESSGSAGGSGAALALPGLLAVARGTTLVRPPRPDVAPPAKLPRLRQDTNNNRNNRDDDDDEAMSRSSGGPTFNIHINVNDIKL